MFSKIFFNLLLSKYAKLSSKIIGNFSNVSSSTIDNLSDKYNWSIVPILSLFTVT